MPSSEELEVSVWVVEWVEFVVGNEMQYVVVAIVVLCGVSRVIGRGGAGVNCCGSVLLWLLWCVVVLAAVVIVEHVVVLSFLLVGAVIWMCSVGVRSSL